jgi:hypothetical protein
VEPSPDRGEHRGRPSERRLFRMVRARRRRPPWRRTDVLINHVDGTMPVPCRAPSEPPRPTRSRRSSLPRGSGSDRRSRPPLTPSPSHRRSVQW